MISLIQLGALLAVIWMPYTDTLLAGLLLILSMRPRQLMAYLMLLWWLSLWIWTQEVRTDTYFMPEQAIYVVGIILLFSEKIIARSQGKKF